jgi:hypothetical protein
MKGRRRRERAGKEARAQHPHRTVLLAVRLAMPAAKQASRRH